MSKILIVSYLFAPASAIGAIRWTKLAKYLAQNGYDIDVLTTSAKAPEDRLLAQDMENAARINIIRIDHADPKFAETAYYKDQQAAASTGAGAGGKPFSRRVKDALWKSRLLKYPTSLYGARQNYARSLDFTRQLQKYISNNLNLSDYAAAICTYGPVGGTMTALWLKKHYPSLPLIMDFRDPMVSLETPWPYSSRYARMQRRICSRADRIIAVTDDLLGRICAGNSEKSVEIPNGCDPADFESIDETVRRADRYSIVYTGSIYVGIADFSPLFRALRELSESGRIDLRDIDIEYIGSSGSELERQAAGHDMKQLVVNEGRLPRSETLARQRSARQLLLTIWNTKKDGGYRPGKILEYMMSGNPSIALISGDQPGSVLRRTIETGRLGIAYENAAAEADYPALLEYLAEDYRRWKQGLDPAYEPDSEYIESFSYPELAKRVAAVIEDLKK